MQVYLSSAGSATQGGRVQAEMLGAVNTAKRFSVRAARVFSQGSHHRSCRHPWRQGQGKGGGGTDWGDSTFTQTLEKLGD